MKTRKTLKKKRTSKKYKTWYRRYNKHNNLTSKMKGGGAFGWFTGHPPVPAPIAPAPIAPAPAAAPPAVPFEPSAAAPPAVPFEPSAAAPPAALSEYVDWIDKLEWLQEKIAKDTLYLWLYTNDLREERLQSIGMALARFKKQQNIEEDSKIVLGKLIKNYRDREADSKINTMNSQQIAKANTLLSRLKVDSEFSTNKDWLKKYIEHLRSINSGLNKVDNFYVETRLQQINNNHVMNSKQAAIAVAPAAAVEPVANADNATNMKVAAEKKIVEKRPEDKLNEDIQRLITAVEDDSSIAEKYLEKTKDDVLRWLNMLIENLSKKEPDWPSLSDQSKLVKLEELYNLSFFDRLRQSVARLLSPTPSPPLRLGAKPKPVTVTPFNREALEKFMAARNADQEESLQKAQQKAHQQNGGKSKHTVKRNVKSKKRRR